MVTRYFWSNTVSVSDEKMSELAFVCRTNENETLEEIQNLIGDKNITSAQFSTENGDYDNLHVRYNQPSFEYGKVWQKVSSTDDPYEYLNNVLPHGSGINGTWYYETKGNVIIASNEYEHMSSVGFYDGSVSFKVYLRKYATRELNSNFEVQKITLGARSLMTVDEEGNEYNDIDGIRDYLNEIFGLSC